MAASDCPHCQHPHGVGVTLTETGRDILYYLCLNCGRAWNPWPEGYDYFYRAQESVYLANFARGLSGYSPPGPEELAALSAISERDGLRGSTMTQAEADRRWLLRFAMRLLHERMPRYRADWDTAWNELLGYIREADADSDPLLPSDLLDYMGELRHRALEPVRAQLGIAGGTA